MQIRLVTTILDYPFIKSPTATIDHNAILKQKTPITKIVAITVAMRTELKIDIAICFMFM